MRFRRFLPQTGLYHAVVIGVVKNASLEGTGGEGGIRTLDTGVSPYNGLANRRLQPLGHLSGVFNFYFTTGRLNLPPGLRKTGDRLDHQKSITNRYLPVHLHRRGSPWSCIILI
jgi:hypothetical protein